MSLIVITLPPPGVAIPNPYVESLIPSVDGIWRWRLWKGLRVRWGQGGEALLMALASPWEETEESFLSLCQSQTHREEVMQAHSKLSQRGAQKRVSSLGTESAKTLISEFLASKTERENKFLLFRPSVSAIKNYHKPSSLKQHKFILL